MADNQSRMRSTDETIELMRQAVERLDVVESLMRDHIRGCNGVSSPQVVELFADQIRGVVFSMYEQMTDLNLSISVEAHRKF